MSIRRNYDIVGSCFELEVLLQHFVDDIYIASVMQRWQTHGCHGSNDVHMDYGHLIIIHVSHGASLLYFVFYQHLNWSSVNVPAFL